jgi:alkylation response protein AidB-like acyl-CoA dehydrogenase
MIQKLSKHLLVSTCHDSKLAEASFVEDRPRRIRAIATSSLAPLAEAIDRKGLYPRQVLKDLAHAGAFSAHLRSHGEPGDLGLSIHLIAEIARVCGSTGFVGWCQAACGLYMEASGNPALQEAWLERHIRGEGLGGTGLSNPIKTYAGLEKLLLRATPKDDGYLLNGSLPWVSHLQPDGYCGVIAAVVEPDGRSANHEVMALVRSDSPGVTLLPCPAFSGMEGTSTFALRLNEVWIRPEEVISRDAATFITGIRSSFVLLQCGFGLGVIQGAIASIHEPRGPNRQVNRQITDQAESLQDELDSLWQRIDHLARKPCLRDPADRLAVLEARAQCSELSLRATQSALLHHGANGYLARSPVQRRIRESHFVAIVTPSLKQLRQEIRVLSNPAAQPVALVPLRHL